MNKKPRHRLATTLPLKAQAAVALEGNAAHYLTTVLRLGVGDAVMLFNRTDGEWLAHISDVKKRAVVLTAMQQLRPAQTGPDFMVCYAPIKGGRLETIIEKATELGAAVLQPVITQRTIVDKVNAERAESIAREAAEQCERTDWPEMRPPVKLAQLLGDWPADRLLVYGDETGEGMPIAELFSSLRGGEADTAIQLPSLSKLDCFANARNDVMKWAILAGPEGGFTPEELALLKRCKSAVAVSLGPRILRADTAIITLAALTLSAWGDWHQPPRFEGAPA